MDKQLNLYCVMGLKTFSVQWEFLGLFSSRKKAKKAIKNIVGHKVKWRTPLAAPDICETTDVIGFSHITIEGLFVDEEYMPSIRIKTTMDFAMQVEEKNDPIDNFLNSIG